MENKKILKIGIIVVIIGVFMFLGYKGFGYLNGAEINVNSPVLSKSVDEDGKPVDIFAEKPIVDKKDKDKKIELPIIERTQKSFVASAKKNPLHEMEYSFIRIYKYDDSVDMVENTKEDDKDKASCEINRRYTWVKLSETKCSLTKSNYYNLVIEDLDKMEEGHYKVEFMNSNKVLNTTIEFILK